LQAVNVAASPATAAKINPNSMPLLVNEFASWSGLPIVLVATKPRPKPSTSL